MYQPIRKGSRHYFESLLFVSEERPTKITDRLRMRERVFENANQNITRFEVEKVLKKLKPDKYWRSLERGRGFGGLQEFHRTE